MLVKGNDIIGRDVFTLKLGKFVAKIEDLIYDPYSNKVLALLLSGKGLFSENRVLELPDIVSVGPDAIMIEAEEVLRPVSASNHQVVKNAKQDKFLTSSKILTENGTRLGEVIDIFFDTETGIVDELEVSQGIKDIKSGRKRVKLVDVLTVGRDATIVRVEAQEKIMEQRTGGIDAIIDDVRASVPEQKTNLRRDLSNVQKDLGSLVKRSEAKINELAKATRDELQRVSTHERTKSAKDKASRFQEYAYSQVRKTADDRKQRQKQNAVGQYLTKTILSPNDDILGKRGEMVTNSLIKKSEDMGILDQVLNSLSFDPI